MKEDKLGDFSMELSVEVLRLTKDCVQSTKMLYPIKSAEAQQASAPILPKVNTPMGELILLLNLRFRSRKPTKQVNGLRCCGKAVTTAKNNLNAAKERA